MIRTSIVIGALNHLEDCTKPCLESIIEHTDLAEVEVIVVANGCSDGTEAYVQSLGPPFRLLSFAEPLGFAKAYNEGMKAAHGEVIVLLNNDTKLLPQKKGEWLRMLRAPFDANPGMGVTGPFMAYSEPANDTFLIFFCAAISRQTLERVGLLDEVFGAGGGEDVDFCIRARRAGLIIEQVPSLSKLNIVEQGGHPVGVGAFPIFHAGHVTLRDLPDYNPVFVRNNKILAERYNSQNAFGNGWERHVFLKHDDIKGDIHRREIARYKFAAANLTGKRVLELGCSAGYAKRFLPAGLDYTGVDYSPEIVQLANENYGGDGYKFICADINDLDWAALGHFDTIIAFEVLEHLEHGREIAQALKEHCDTLICSTPYREPPGLHGKWHLLHRLTEHDFPGFEHSFIQWDGEIAKCPDNDYGHNLLLFKWQRGRVYPSRPRILACVSTKDRYEILPLCLHSIAMQTLRPSKLVIFDDGEHRDLREHPIYKPTFAMLASRGIEWEVIFGPRRGQHWNHEHANNMGFEFVWRIDDDEVAEPDVLEKLMSHFTPEVGAVGGAVFEPGGAQPGGTGKLADIYSGPNLQWMPGEGVVEVEHLYSSFVYRAGLAHYDLDLSPVAHREETIFSHLLASRGLQLLVDRSARTYHYRQATGGIRSHGSEFYYKHDEAIFARHMERWGVKLISLTVGLGDNFAFLNLLPALKKRYPSLVIGTCYPEVFAGHGVRIIPMADAARWCSDNVYSWMQTNEWKGTLLEAFCAMYGVSPDDLARPIRAKIA
ncbi:MAG TPA: glycosyltransferase [Burkholderiales bacterium]